MFFFTFYKWYFKVHIIKLFFPDMEYFNRQMFSQLPVNKMVKIRSIEFHLHCMEQGDSEKERQQIWYC